MRNPKVKEATYDIQNKLTLAYNLAHKAPGIPPGFEEQVYSLDIKANRIQLVEICESIIENCGKIDEIFLNEARES